MTLKEREIEKQDEAMLQMLSQMLEMAKAINSLQGSSVSTPQRLSNDRGRGSRSATGSRGERVRGRGTNPDRGQPGFTYLNQSDTILHGH